MSCLTATRTNCKSNCRNHTKSFWPLVRTGAIPVGIAVARQRLQAEHAQQHQQKEINRFGGIGITTDLGKSSFIHHITLTRYIYSQVGNMHTPIPIQEL